MNISNVLKKARRQNFISDCMFTVIMIALLISIFVMLIYPIWFVLIASVSNQDAVNAGKVILFPDGFDIAAYKRVLTNMDFYRGFGNSLFYTIIGTILNVIVTLAAAYSLSRRDLKGRSFIMVLFIITMYFNGGMIPGYLNVKSMGLTNTRTIMLLIGLVTPYNLIVCRTYFMNAIPWELQEAAFIDGASDFQIFIRIIIPLSKAIVSVLVIYYGVVHWNDYFNAMIYLKDEKLYPVQIFLRETLLKSNYASMLTNDNNAQSVSSMMVETNVANQLKYALIVLSSAPILAIYPMFEKHFSKGVMIGAVKG